MSRIVVAIDPGTDESAVVVWDGSVIIGAKILTNHQLLCLLRESLNDEDAAENTPSESAPVRKTQRAVGFHSPSVEAKECGEASAVFEADAGSQANGLQGMAKAQQGSPSREDESLSGSEPTSNKALRRGAHPPNGLEGDIQRIPSTLECAKPGQAPSVLSSEASIGAQQWDGFCRTNSNPTSPSKEQVSLLRSANAKAPHRPQDTAVSGRQECGSKHRNSVYEMQPKQGLKDGIRIPKGCFVAIEMFQSFGMAVGREVFETCLLIGRLVEILDSKSHAFTLVYRRDVKLHHCGSARAKDANVRQALIDKYGAPGKKSNPGTTYGLKSHLWQAFAIATMVTEREAK